MPNKPINEERLSEPLNFVVTPTMRNRVVGTASKRGVSYATACRWAVEYWLAHGAPAPAESQQPEESAS